MLPAALFLLRALAIARRLKRASEAATAADVRELRQAREALRAHRAHLRDDVAAPRTHLAAARDLRRSAVRPARAPKGLDRMVEDFLPERRL